MTDLESIRLQITSRLPARVRWLINGTPLDFDFSRAQAPLKPVTPADLNGLGIDDSWQHLCLFGQENFAEGGGANPYLAVDRDTGQIFGLDVERDSAQLFLLNSDIERYILTFQRFDQALRLKTLGPDRFLDELRKIDPCAFARSDWRSLSNHITR